MNKCIFNICYKFPLDCNISIFSSTCLVFDEYLHIISAIEDEYNGPALEDGKVTLKFMMDLMETYKNQGKLHRKFAYKVSPFRIKQSKLLIYHHNYKKIKL